MSKWLDKSKFNEWEEKKVNEKEKEPINSFYPKLTNPPMGPNGKPREYEFRLLPDLDGTGYKTYFYHMFKVGESWEFFACPKTHGLDEYCPWCAISGILYKGNASDKAKAKEYSRKQKYVSNIYVVNDPRDAEESDPKKKVNGTVRLYEFPSTVEKKFKAELTNKKSGYGQAIFDPEKDGVNFQLIIEAKKPDPDGKVWPDHSQSMFNRKSSPMVDDESKLEELMNKRINLEEYIKSMFRTAADHKALLKKEMIFDDVAAEFNKFMATEPSTESEKPAEEKKEKESAKKSDEKTKEKVMEDDVPTFAEDDLSDEALLASLDSLSK